MLLYYFVFSVISWNYYLYELSISEILTTARKCLHIVGARLAGGRLTYISF